VTQEEIERTEKKHGRPMFQGRLRLFLINASSYVYSGSLALAAEDWCRESGLEAPNRVYVTVKDLLYPESAPRKFVVSISHLTIYNAISSSINT